ncbi:16S rRNA pseudouridine(516) synthase [Paracidovorax avenae]|uniref:pseudouridine synthase n=1 Tax=Paracidovorax avenae TaxID=80867 RepID=UPI000D177EAF|nr:16S rRNA pseudouridine(516) synthase [Paracidovorax avenae]AVS61516.1 16S rRNA pseudouridine(516) synthase [Paracidovorax avenae]
MQLQEILYSQGFGTRRVCAGLIQHGHVQLRKNNDTGDAWVCTDASLEIDPGGLTFHVQGKVWQWHERAYVMMNKPAAVECSQKPSTYPSVYTLLPDPLRQRPGPGKILGVQTIGRLDQDTTGLLLLSDDGSFIHRVSSPKKQIQKTYRVHAKYDLSQQQKDQLLKGVVLNDDPKPVIAADCVLQEGSVFDLTVTEGKYHQIKRMVAAVGNRVEQLHRIRIGGLHLPDDLQAGDWRWLGDDDVRRIFEG